MIGNKQESYIILQSTEEKAFCRNIFFTAWDQGQRASNVELLHSKKKKGKQWVCSNTISWHHLLVVARHDDDKTIQQFVRLEVLQS